MTSGDGDGPRWYGYTREQWARLVDVAYRFLVECASRQRTTTYTDLCMVLRSQARLPIEPHDHALPHLLGDVATRSHKEREVAITALVTYVDDSRPGPGFFVIAQDLGLLPPGKLREAQKLEFHVEHVKQVLAAYED